jgi:hypothetical protein
LTILDDRWRFRVDQKRHAAACENRHRLPQITLADMWKLVDARRHEKAFEPAHARVDERVQFTSVSRHHAAPEPDVHAAAPARSARFGLERHNGCRRGNAVEWHVHDRRHAPCRRSPGRGLEPFPLGAARFVDVYVRVHDARRDHEIADVGDVSAGRRLVRSDRPDGAVDDVNGSRSFAVRQDDAATSENQHQITAQRV